MIAGVSRCSGRPQSGRWIYPAFPPAAEGLGRQIGSQSGGEGTVNPVPSLVAERAVGSAVEEVPALFLLLLPQGDVGIIAQDAGEDASGQEVEGLGERPVRHLWSLRRGLPEGCEAGGCVQEAVPSRRPRRAEECTGLSVELGAGEDLDAARLPRLQRLRSVDREDLEPRCVLVRNCRRADGGGRRRCWSARRWWIHRTRRRRKRRKAAPRRGAAGCDGR